MVETINKSLQAPVSGVKMCGATGTDGSGPQTFDWFTVPNARTSGFGFKLEGTTANHMTLSVEGCVVGMEDHPETLVTVDASGATVSHTQSDKAYDKFRVKVTKQTAEGAGTQVRMSVRP